MLKHMHQHKWLPNMAALKLWRQHSRDSHGEGNYLGLHAGKTVYLVVMLMDAYWQSLMYKSYGLDNKICPGIWIGAPIFTIR